MKIGERGLLKDFLRPAAITIWLLFLISPFRGYAADGTTGILPKVCYNGIPIYTEYNQLICPGTEQERWVKGSTVHYIYFPVPCPPGGVGGPGGIVVGGGGGSQSGGGGGGGGAYTSIAKQDCFSPG